VLAALACAWKLSGNTAADAVSMASAARQYSQNFVMLLAGAGLLSFILKRHRLLLNLGCVAGGTGACPCWTGPDPVQERCWPHSATTSATR
jgi:hypothetical protein